MLLLLSSRTGASHHRALARGSLAHRAVIVAALVGIDAQPGPLDDAPEIDNPWASRRRSIRSGSRVLLVDPQRFIGSLAAPLVMRYPALPRRRAPADQVGRVAAAVVAGVVAGSVARPAHRRLPTASRSTLVAVAFAAFPVAIGVAILRYRLYDIDVVINRALVYGALTATLAGTYLGSVLLLQLLLGAVHPGLRAWRSPARHWRPRRCSARRAPASRRGRPPLLPPQVRRRPDPRDFGARLRDEVDLDALTDELRTVIAETMQPAHVALWLREQER